MAVELATGYVNLVASAKGIKGSVEKELSGIGDVAEASGKKSASRFTGAVKGIGGALLVGGTLTFLKASQSAAGVDAKAAAQTAAVIKSTGGIANVSTDQVDKLSGQLQKLSGVEDESIQAGANMLLTFTNLRNEAGKGNDVFNQATKTLLDMSVATGTDAKTSAVQLGKALNDPIAGIGALSRVGVTFTAQQKEQIKALVASGNTMGAQKIILAELNKEFGGSAKALGDARTPAEKFSLAMGDLQVKVGTLVIPALNGMATGAAAVFGWFSRLGPVGQGVILVVLGLAAAAFVIVKAVQAWTAVQAALNVVLVANPIGLVVLAIAALVAGLVLAYNHSATFRNIVQGAFAVVGAVVGTVANLVRRFGLDFIAALTGPIAPFIILARHSETFRNVLKGAFEIVLIPAKALKAVIDAIVDAIAAAIRLAGRLAKAIPDLPSLPKGLNKVPGVPLLAHGGPVSAGRPVIVGDGGVPELFIPDVDGRVLPRVPSSSASTGAGGVHQENHFHGGDMPTEAALDYASRQLGFRAGAFGRV